MTVIIGLESNNKVYIGCDSALIENWTQEITALPKIFKLGSFLIGVAGYPRAQQIIQYHLKLPKQLDSQTDLQYLCTDFVDTIIQLMSEHDFGKTENNQKTLDSSIIFGYHGKLYEIDTNYQIIKVKSNFSAIGSGKDLALGAMNALDSVMLIESMKPETKIKIALETTAKYNIGVAKPFKVMSI